ncbi:response regulator [Gandjariella thermophila]|uniref:Transcriptional regulatory protein n=1 Tax=Gandjariella thermophila TaxID=1931992 RepID=A0A4D4JAU6_9PSEU|nr:response regulator [Gandjariella thermophila]GDY32684.1 transcriptional regulatory protein [Gandjariella thermophila]
MIRTLVVDDDYRVAAIHAAYLRRVPGFAAVGPAHSAAEARAAIAAERVQLILLDLYLPDEHGLDLVRALPDSPDRPDFIAITAGRDVRNIRTAMQLGAVHYLVKPFRFARLAELLTAYRDVQERLTTLREARQDDVDHLYGLLRPPTLPAPSKGHSAPTLALIRDTLRAADTDMSATEVAAQLGVSRPTAQRYLSYLARHGVVELLLRYGTTGRPEHRYRYRVAP